MSPLFGRFGNTTGRPYIEGRLVFAALKVAIDVSFLVDTGADQTTLMPIDGMKAGLDYTKLVGKQKVGGVGGTTDVFVEPALAIFAEEGEAVHAYAIRVCLVSPRPDTMDLPSLLGRDVLDQWRMAYSPTEGQLSFDILQADASFAIGPGAPPAPSQDGGP